MIDELIGRKIDGLNEYEAKVMLKAIYVLIDIALTGDGGDEMVKEVINRLNKFYQDLPISYENSG